jgi:hypothetical protein
MAGYDDLVGLAGRGLELSPVHEVLIEESVIGWKEYELEVMRDKADNVVIICSIENLDPMGVHTGDSITVAPAMTLTDREYQRMRDVAIGIIRAVGVGWRSERPRVSPPWLSSTTGSPGTGDDQLLEPSDGCLLGLVASERAFAGPLHGAQVLERLGIAGCTGSCTGTHLHFELRDRKVPIDPMPLITGYNRTL